MMSRMPVSKWFGLPLLIYVRGSFMCIAVCAIVVLVGCREEEARTPLVRRLEAAGAGDLSRASVNSIQQWLQQHEDLALQTKRDCERVQASGAGPANWGDTTEKSMRGRLQHCVLPQVLRPRIKQSLLGHS